MRPVIKGIEYTTRDYEGFRSLMLDQLSVLMPEYTDKRQSDAGVVILELNAMCLDILSYYLDSVANECFLVTAEQRSSIMKFCKMLGYTPRFATSARYKQIFVKSNPDTSLTIPRGTKLKTFSNNPNNVVYFTTLEDLTLGEGISGDEKDSEGNYLYTVEVIHGLFVNDELLNDKAGGEPNQRYSLKYAPVLINDDFLNVYVSNLSQGTASQRWNRVNNFAGSNSTSQVFMVENNDYNETSILFGDNSFGLAPSNNAVITCSYVVGGGDKGNVGLGSITVLEDNLAGISSTSNVEVVSEGSEAESLEEIKVNAPVSHRNIWGALTVDDFSGVVKATFSNIKDAEARRASDNWSDLAVDDIEVFLLTNQEVSYAKENELRVIPEEWYSDNTQYTNTLENIEGFFDSNTDYIQIGTNTVLDGARKLAGVRNVILSHPKFQGLNIDYTLIVKSYYNIDEISQKIDQFILDFFQLGNLDFGEDISLQELSYLITEQSSIEGIRYLNIKLAGLPIDEKGEYSNDKFSLYNNDLVVPNKGTLFYVSGFSRHFPET